jgi:hypothetical protein
MQRLILAVTVPKLSDGEIFKTDESPLGLFRRFVFFSYAVAALQKWRFQAQEVRS